MCLPKQSCQHGIPVLSVRRSSGSFSSLRLAHTRARSRTHRASFFLSRARTTSREGKAQMATGHVATNDRLKFLNFHLEHASPVLVQGRFVVDDRSAQSFGVLHGGVSAFIAEELASVGAFSASGNQRVAAVQLSINHLKAAPIGTDVFVSAKPSQLGKRLQVWDVIFCKDEASSEQIDKDGMKLAVSRVVLMSGLTGQLKEYVEKESRIPARL